MCAPLTQQVPASGLVVPIGWLMCSCTCRRTLRQVLMSVGIGTRGRCFETAAWKQLQLRIHVLSQVSFPHLVERCQLASKLRPQAPKEQSLEATTQDRIGSDLQSVLPPHMGT